MNQHARTGALVVLLSLAGLASHALPHPMGVSTVGAVGMVAAAYLPRSWVMAPVLVTILVVDAINGFYGALAMSFVYIGHLAAALSVRRLLKSVSVKSVAFASILSAVVFYLLSNLTPMAMGYYPNTFHGWVACYVAALPFLLKGILANMVYGGLAFGTITIIGGRNAHRVLVAKRD